MISVTLVLGLTMIATGVMSYIQTGSEHPTALIPAGVGAVFFVLGVVALKPGLRKHAMHAAALVGLLGFAATVEAIVQVGALVPALIGEMEAFFRQSLKNPDAVLAKTSMALLCFAYLGLCVQSFITARRLRKEGK